MQISCVGTVQPSGLVRRRIECVVSYVGVKCVYIRCGFICSNLVDFVNDGSAAETWDISFSRGMHRLVKQTHLLVRNISKLSDNDSFVAGLNL
jgi:hypothetical protein